MPFYFSGDKYQWGCIAKAEWVCYTVGYKREIAFWEIKYMKKRSITLIFSVFLTFCLSGCVSVVENKDPKVIAVISKEDQGSFWHGALAGAEDAALQNGYAITFRGPETQGQEGLESQKKIIQLALDNEVCGMVIAAVGPGLMNEMETANSLGLPVVQFDSGLYPLDLVRLKNEKNSPVISSVCTQDRKAGALAAEGMFENIRRDITLSMIPYVVGVIQHDMSPSGENRTLGFLDRFRELADGDSETAGKYELKVHKCISGKNGTYVQAMNVLKQQRVRAILLTNQDAVEQIYDEICAHPGKYDYLVFAGFDGGRKQINWMRSDIGAKLLGSVTQNAYEIGYNAVMQCINGLEARGVTAFVELPGVWYDRKNLEEMIRKNLVYE